jgi:hypothetical protein
MLGVAALLTMIGEAGAEPLVNFYDSYLSWTAGMLPLFYVPALAVVPSLLQGEYCCCNSVVLWPRCIFRIQHGDAAWHMSLLPLSRVYHALAAFAMQELAT